MKVFVAGASGALGRPLVRQLVEAGYEVTGLTTNRPELVASLGAKPAVANAFAADDLKRVVTEANPEAVINALTRIPNVAIVTPSRLKVNDRLRIEGTRNLIEAARAAGAPKFLSESITFAFEGRSEVKMRPLVGMGSFSEAISAALSLEEQTHAYKGIVLRYGYFYGPGTSFDDAIPKALRRKVFHIVGKGTAWWSFIHVEDAAAATVAALERGKPGETFNIVDDEPILARDALDFIAEKAGAGKPLRLPEIGPYYARHYFNKATGASNEKAKAELPWAPRYPDLKAGYGK